MLQNSKNFKVTRGTIFTSFFTQFVQYGINLFVLPIILNRFSSDTLAIWYIFISIHSITNLLDFGLSPSFTRFFSYIFSGANKIEDIGIPKEYNINQISIPLLNDLLYITKRSYLIISCTIFLLLLIFGSLYLNYIIEIFHNFKLLSTWILFAIVISFGYYVNYYIIIIRGKGLITLNNIIIISSKIIYLLVLIIAIEIGLGITSMVLALGASVIIQIIICSSQYLNKEEKKELSNLNTSYFGTIKFKTIWTNAQKVGLTSIGVFLLSQTGVILSSIFLSLDDVAKLGLILQLFSVLVVISRVCLTTYIPKISALWIRGEKDRIKRYFTISQLTGYLIYIGGVIFCIILGNKFLNIIHSQTMLPDNCVIILYGIFYLMEITHGNCTTLISTKNEIPFYVSAIISGIVSLAITIFLLKFDFGIYSFPIGLILGSLPYNSWKWPLVVYRDLYK